MGDLSDIVNSRKDYKKVREDNYKQESRLRLSKILKKKIQTTMIGALSSLEEHFSFLWTSDSGELSSDQKTMLNLYNNVRSEILDKGNNQLRNIDAELAQYEVEWQRYHMDIPFIKKED